MCFFLLIKRKDRENEANEIVQKTQKTIFLENIENESSKLKSTC